MRTFPDAFSFVVAAIAFLLIPLPWLMAWFTAVIIHELGHYFALKACGITVYSVGIKLSGVYMNTSPMSVTEELVCSLSGPVCGLCMLFLSGHFPRLAICATLQSCYNLLPLYPLDGGRGVRCILQMLFCVERSVKIERVIRYGCLGMLILLGCVAAFVWKLELLPILLGFWILCRNGNSKTPCKEDKQIVQ